MEKQLLEKVILLLIIGTLISAGSCKKYEDGPLISLRSKTSRLSGEWEITNNNSGTTADIVQLLYFDKDGGYLYIIKDSSSEIDRIEGSWEWIDDKQSITITTNKVLEAEILRLTDKELWFNSNKIYKCEKNK